jgi:copper transport protein
VLCALLLVLGMTQGGATRVLAHAAYVGSDPAADSVVPTSPERVTAWFTEPMAPTASSIEVLDALGRRVDLGDSRVHPDDLFRMSVSTPDLPNGTYTVSWRNVSTVDGHGIQGSFLFYVGSRPPDAAASETAEPPLLQSRADPVVRWVTLLGALAVVGGLLFEPAVLRPAVQRASRREGATEVAARRSRALISKLVWGGLALFLVGSLGQLLIQAGVTAGVAPYSVAPGDISDVLGTEWGTRWLARVACIAGVAIVLLGASRLAGRRPGLEPAIQRFAWLPASAFAIGALFTVSLSSHGAAVTDLELPGTLNDFMHLLAAGVWVGGLFALLITLWVARSVAEPDRRGLLAALAARFSIFAGASVGVLVVTGLYSSFLQVTTRRAFDTPYGSALTLKLALVAALIALAAANLLWVRPRLRDGRGGPWLRRFVTAEVVLAVAVVLTVGVLTSLEPARQVKNRDDQRSALSFSETVEGTRIEGSIGPGTAGTNRVTVELADDSGDPITDASNVLVRLRYLDRDLSPIEVTAPHTGGGTYEPPPVVLAIAGAWQVEVEVARPGAFDARTASRFEVTSAPELAGAFASAAVPTDQGRTYWSYVVMAVGAIVLVVLPLGWRSRPARARLRILGTAVVLAGVVLFYGAHSHEDSALASVPETNPYPPDNQSLEVGRQLYTEHCVSCHGVAGHGDGPEAETLIPKPADLATHVPLHTDGQIFYFITNGFPGTAMPAWGNTLTEEQRWHLVNYLRTLAAPLPTQ